MIIELISNYILSYFIVIFKKQATDNMPLTLE